jgi:uncharacterized membrane protein YfcA
MEKSRHMEKLFCGAAVGAANSLFGGGGGMIAVPLLQKTRMDERRAHATAILIILPVSLVSFLFYVFQGAYDTGVLIPTAIGVTAGGLLGAKLLGKLPIKIVGLLFIFFQALAGISLLFFR